MKFLKHTRMPATFSLTPLATLATLLLRLLGNQHAQAQGFDYRWREKSAAQLRASLTDFYENIFAQGEPAIHQWFAPEYIQISDGKTLDFKDFLSHIKVVSATVKSIRFEVCDAAYTGNLLADRHLVHITKISGEKMVFEVLAFFQIKNGKIYRANETTRMMHGDNQDHDLGSRSVLY